MKIFDCFMYFDEDIVLDVRLNHLYSQVDKFIIVEAKYNHKGEARNPKFDINNFSKFKDKIVYLLIDEEAPFIEKIYDSDTDNEKYGKQIMNSLKRENFQRNYITKGLHEASDEDWIIISDLDEIPDLSQIDLQNIDEKIYAFQQINTMYKFNLVRGFDWIGSKLCKFKKLKSPQWIRSLKVRKKYSYFRIDKFFSSNYTHNFEVIKKGGWHFGWIRDIDQIINKLESFAHAEFNNNKFKNYQFINECMKKNLNFLDTTENLTKIKMSLLPNYLLNNKDKFKSYLK